MPTQPRASSDVADELLMLLRRRMHRWADTSLADAVAGDATFADPDDAIVELLLQHPRQLASWLASADAAPVLAERTLRWFRARNQFATVDAAALEEHYARGLRATAHLLRDVPPRQDLVTGLRAILGAHGAWIAGFISDQVGPEPADVVSSRYSPGLQLEALGRPPTVPPLLDVGCGDGALVGHLRGRGVDATGLDLDGTGDVLMGDWLTFDYGHRRWHTVVSHLAFSLHFLHHELRRSDRALTYGRTYVRILTSLRRGGTFAYVPSLPFIEVALDPSAWEVTRHRVPFATLDATHVHRR